MREFILQALSMAFRNDFKVEYLDIKSTEETTIWNEVSLLKALTYRDRYLCFVSLKVPRYEYDRWEKAIKERMDVQFLSAIMKGIALTTENNIILLAHKYEEESKHVM